MSHLHIVVSPDTEPVAADFFLAVGLGHEELADSEIVLHDIDEERLATSALVARRVCEAVKASASR